MTFRLFFYFMLSLFVQPVHGQLSLTDPMICHDKNKYLTCYRDGSCIMTFHHGNFETFRTADSTFTYSNVYRTITFLYHPWQDLTRTDTIRIIQLPRSILLKNGRSSIEITSLKNIPKEIDDYGIGTYQVNAINEGFTFWSGDRFVKLLVSTYDKIWSWDLVLHERDRYYMIGYNGYKKNRLEDISIQDDSLRYGMTLSNSFRSLKKIWRLESLYVDTIRTLPNGTQVIGAVPLSNYYGYIYRRSGRLKQSTATKTGELKLCDCH